MRFAVETIRLILLLALLAGCALPTASPTPREEPARLVVTPILEPWLARMLAAYAHSGAGLNFTVEVLPPKAGLEAVSAGRASLLVAAIQPPSGWFATPLGREPLAFVLDPDIPLEALTLTSLAGLLSGQIRTWDQLGGPALTVQPLVPLPGDEARQLLIDLFLGSSAFAPHALLAPSPTAVVRMLATKPGAIGLLPVSQPFQTGKLASLDGLEPLPAGAAQSDYPLVLSIVATAEHEPQGSLRAWLGWMQSGAAALEQSTE